MRMCCPRAARPHGPAAVLGDRVRPGLEALVETTLEMSSLSLARELTCAATGSERAAELSKCVDRWCELDARLQARAAAAKPGSQGKDDVACASYC